MSKQLETLLEKALRTGYANLNGRKREYGYIGELERKWSFTYNNETGILRMYHWGTLILEFGSLKSSKPIVKSYYGQSKSDRDGLQFVFDWFDTGYSASYKPSKNRLDITADFGLGYLQTYSI